LFFWWIISEITFNKLVLLMNNIWNDLQQTCSSDE
jgi:hypothetical protein